MTPRDYQLLAATLASTKDRCGLEMTTGSGKSLTIALLIQKLQLKTLVVVPTLGLKYQLTEVLQSLFVDIRDRVVVENIASKNLKKRGDFDVLIIDECHHAASSTYRELNRKYWGNIYHRYFFSATFFRNDEEERLLLESLVGNCAYSFGYREAVAADAIVPIEAYYIDLPKETSNAYGWHEVYKERVVNNAYRNLQIVGLLKSLEGKSVLCLVKEIEHGEILSRMTGIPFANGADEDTRGHIEEFNSGAIKALIGTTGILGEGVDSRPCEYVVIAGLGKAKSAFQQQVGRAVRKYPGKESAKVIIFKDGSHKYCLRHFNAQKKILKEEYGVTPIKIEL